MKNSEYFQMIADVQLEYEQAQEDGEPTGEIEKKMIDLAKQGLESVKADLVKLREATQ